MKIGDRIYQEREKQEMSARELSKKAGLSNAMISLYERNVNVPSIEKLKAIAHALNVPISKLLDEDATLYQPHTNLKKEEQDLLHYYRLVDATAKTTIMNVAKIAYEAQIKIVQSTYRAGHTA